MFKHPMKKILAEKYGAAYAAEIMKKSRTVYRQLVERAVGPSATATHGV